MFSAAVRIGLPGNPPKQRLLPKRNLCIRSTWDQEQRAVEAIFNFIQRTELRGIADKLHASQAELHQIARQRFRKGLLPRQEVDKVYIDLQNTLARLKDANIRVATTKAALVSQLGHSDIHILWPWQRKFQQRRLSKIESKYEVARTPGFLALDYDFAAQSQRVKQNFRTMFFSLDLDLLYNVRTTDVTPNEWSATATISIPLFDQLTNYSRYASQVEIKREAELALEEARRTLSAEHISLKTTYETALDTALSRAESLDIARRLYEDNVRRFRRGRINANELQLDQERLFRSEQFAIEGWNQVHVAFSELCHSYGSRLSECLAQDSTNPKKADMKAEDTPTTTESPAQVKKPAPVESSAPIEIPMPPKKSKSKSKTKNQ